MSSRGNMMPSLNLQLKHTHTPSSFDDDNSVNLHSPAQKDSINIDEILTVKTPEERKPFGLGSNAKDSFPSLNKSDYVSRPKFVSTSGFSYDRQTARTQSVLDVNRAGTSYTTSSNIYLPIPLISDEVIRENEPKIRRERINQPSQSYDANRRIGLMNSASRRVSDSQLIKASNRPSAHNPNSIGSAERIRTVIKSQPEMKLENVHKKNESAVKITIANSSQENRKNQMDSLLNIPENSQMRPKSSRLSRNETMPRKSGKVIDLAAQDDSSDDDDDDDNPSGKNTSESIVSTSTNVHEAITKAVHISANYPMIFTHTMENNMKSHLEKAIENQTSIDMSRTMMQGVTCEDVLIGNRRVVENALTPIKLTFHNNAITCYVFDEPSYGLTDGNKIPRHSISVADIISLHFASLEEDFKVVIVVNAERFMKSLDGRRAKATSYSDFWIIVIGQQHFVKFTEAMNRCKELSEKVKDSYDHLQDAVTEFLKRNERNIVSTVPITRIMSRSREIMSRTPSRRKEISKIDLVSDDEGATMSSGQRRSARLRGRRGYLDVDADWTESDKELILIWNGITIYRGDMKRLDPNKYLNDSLIDLANSYHVDQIEPDLKSHIHIFSCQFLSKYMEIKDPQAGHKLVCRWTTNVDLFDMEYIFVPINHAKHWSLMCILRPRCIYQEAANKFQSLHKQSDSNAEMTENAERLDDTHESTNENRSCILFLDSLGMHSANTFGQALRGYLKFEWLTKKGPLKPDTPVQFPQEFVEILMKLFDTLPIVKCKAPIQENGFDCGVYVIKFVQWILEKNPSSSDEIIKNKFQDYFTPALFDKNGIVSCRTELKSLIEILAEKWESEKREKKERKELKKAAKLAKLLGQDSNMNNDTENVVVESNDSTSSDDNSDDSIDAHIEIVHHKKHHHDIKPTYDNYSSNPTQLSQISVEEVKYDHNLNIHDNVNIYDSIPETKANPGFPIEQSHHIRFHQFEDSMQESPEHNQENKIALTEAQCQNQESIFQNDIPFTSPRDADKGLTGEDQRNSDDYPFDQSDYAERPNDEMMKSDQKRVRSNAMRQSSLTSDNRTDIQNISAITVTEEEIDDEDDELALQRGSRRKRQKIVDIS